MIIATDPARFRPIILAAIIEKFSFGVAMVALYMQSRIHPSDLVFAGADLLLGVLFIAAFLNTKTTKT